MTDCIFCRIVEGTFSPAWPVWSDDRHVAFLTPFPNTVGFTVVVPRRHMDSHVLALPDDDFHALMAASRAVGRILERAFDVGRAALIVEGMGVNHAHTKLVPLHGVHRGFPWEARLSVRRDFYDLYPGYIASHDGPPADPASLDEAAAKIRAAAAE